MDRNKRNSLFGRKRSNIINGGFLGKNIFNNSIWQHYLEPWTANPNYWIADRFHDNAVCLLAAFAGTIHVRPANSTFHGGTFIVSPEESLGRRANCERNSRNIFWKFSQHDEKEIVFESEINDKNDDDSDVDDDDGADIIDDDFADDDDNADNFINLASSSASAEGFDDNHDKQQQQKPQSLSVDLIGSDYMGQVIRNDNDNDDDDDDDVDVDDDNLKSSDFNINGRQTKQNLRLSSKTMLPSSSSPLLSASATEALSSRTMIERSNRLLSAGFHVVGSVIEFHVAYIECLQTIDKELVNNNRFQMRDNDVCTNLSVSFDLGTFGNPQSYECNHIWSKTLRDVHYNQNKRRYAGEVQISLKWVRIDKDPLGVAPYSFRRARRKCVWDTIFGWQSLTIMGSLLIFFIIGFFGLCVCSNSSCHDDETGEWTNNWCCMLCCCFSCCRRRSSRFRSGSLNTQRIVQYEHTPNTTRLECNHHQHHRHHHHHHHHRGPPPPPPPPSSSTSLLTNTSSHPNHIGCGQRKPTFSNSYSYEGTGSNPTQQSSSSAMSTAIDDYYYYKMKNNNENASIHRYNKHDDLVVIAVTPTTTTNDDYNDDKWQILMKELPYQQQEKFSNTIGILGENENEIFQSKINQCDHHQQQWQNCSILMDNNLNSHHNDYKQMPLSIQLSKFNCNNNKNGDGDNNDDDHGYSVPPSDDLD
nr:uncharacterized protein LOC124499288 [Dermatophagoides farinae]